MSSQIRPDDFEIDSYITILNNRQRFPTGFGESVESGMFKGTVLKIRSLNLPYVLVDAADPQFGLKSFVLDVREHAFQKVAEEFADAVIASCQNCQACEPKPEPHRQLVLCIRHTLPRATGSDY